MHNRHEIIVRMAEWIDRHIAEPNMLVGLAQAIGYSPTYCSTQFHLHTGMTLREYSLQRRLYHAAIAIRDSDERLLDIALSCGYSSHQAMTASFRHMFGLSPEEYRRNKRLILLPLPLSPPQQKGGTYMVTNPNIRVEYIPPHQFLGVFRSADIHGEPIWPGHDCDLVTHTVESMSHLADVVVTAHTAGWQLQGEQRSYFYGLGVASDYSGIVPEGFELVNVSGCYYQVVSHPPFDYSTDNAEVMQRVEKIAFMEPCAVPGFHWKKNSCCYQRHFPEGHGYMVLRPIEKD